jgi:hypothetical protein
MLILALGWSPINRRGLCVDKGDRRKRRRKEAEEEYGRSYPGTTSGLSTIQPPHIRQHPRPRKALGARLGEIHGGEVELSQR